MQASPCARCGADESVTTGGAGASIVERMASGEGDAAPLSATDVFPSAPATPATPASMRGATMLRTPGCSPTRGRASSARCNCSGRRTPIVFVVGSTATARPRRGAASQRVRHQLMRSPKQPQRRVSQGEQNVHFYTGYRARNRIYSTGSGSGYVRGVVLRRVAVKNTGMVNARVNGKCAGAGRGAAGSAGEWGGRPGPAGSVIYRSLYSIL